MYRTHFLEVPLYVMTSHDIRVVSVVAENRILCKLIFNRNLLNVIKMDIELQIIPTNLRRDSV